MQNFLLKIVQAIILLLSKKGKENQTIESGTTNIEIVDPENTEETGTTEPIETIEIIKNMVDLRLERVFFGDTYTIGKLYVNGEYFCDTLEDKDRGLTSDMPKSKINSIKIKDETAIPYGKYDITMSVRSAKYSDFSKYSWAKDFNAYIPRLIDVPGFEGILIHPGNYPADTSGCILVGKNTKKGMVTSSQKTFFALMNDVIWPNSEEKITIEIVKSA